MPRKRKRSSSKKPTAFQAAYKAKQSQPQTKGEMIATLILTLIFCGILMKIVVDFTSCMSTPQSVDRTMLEVTEPSTGPPTESLTEPPTEAPTDPPTEAQPVPVPAPQPQVIHFIVNTDSGCIHASAGCSAAQAIAADHRAEIDIPENEIPNYAGTYWACGKCSSHYSAQLPKP